MTSHRDTSNPSKRSEILAYITCSVTGDDVEPEFWTTYFGVEPEISVLKGKVFRTPSGRISSHPGLTGVWGYSSKCALQEDTLSPHFVYLIAKLGLPRPDLTKLLRQKGAKLRFSCYWSNYSGNRNPVVEAKFIEIIKLCGGVIELDEYPQSHKSINADGEEKDILI